MEVEDRIADYDEEELELNEITVSVKEGEETSIEESYEDPYYLMDRLKADSKNKKNSLLDMKISISPTQKHEEPDEEEHERDEIEDGDDDKEIQPFNYDSAMYQKFSSSYKFNNNEIQDFRNMAGTGEGNEEQYKDSWRKAAAVDDEI